MIHSPCSPCPFARLISYNLTSRCAVLLQLPSRSHVVLEAPGPGRALLVYSTCCITRSVLQLCVGASRLAGGGGVKSLLLRERWWWWRWRRRRVEVLIYHRPSLLFHGTLSSYWEFASFRTRLGHLGSHTILTVLST